MARSEVLGFLFMFLFMFLCSCNGTKSPSPALSKDSNSGLCMKAVGSNRQLCLACGLTTYKGLCQQKLMTYPGATVAKPPELAVMGLRLALDAVEQAYKVASKLAHNASSSSSSSSGAIKDCVQLMADSRDQLSLSISTLSNPSKTKRGVDVLKGEIENALVWTSAALTYHTTCADGLKVRAHTASAMAAPVNKISAPLVTNALDLLAHLSNHLCSWQDRAHGDYPAC